MDKIGQLLERGFLGGIVIAAAFVGFAVFLYLVYRLIKFLQPKTVRQEEKRVHSHPFYKVSGRGQIAYLILCLEEVLLFYGQDFSAWEQILRELWSITNGSEGDWIGTWLDSVKPLLPSQILTTAPSSSDDIRKIRNLYTLSGTKMILVSALMESVYTMVCEWAPDTVAYDPDALHFIDETEEMMKKWGIHFVHCSDEWYILAEKELPLEEQYDGYLQLENGVGMLRLFLTEFEEALSLVKEQKIEKEVSLATGRLAYPFIKKMAERLMDKFQGLKIHSYEIKNEFFGENITVSGLITGQDLERQLLGKPLGQRLLIPENMLRCEEYGEVEEKKVFLDDKTVGELEKALQVKIDIVKSSGQDLLIKLLKRHRRRE